MRIRNLTIAAVAAGLALVPATAAGAAPAASPAVPAIPHGLQWEPFRSAPFTSPAGRNCAFNLSAVPVRDEEEIATLATFPDGSPRVQVIRGDLRVRYTNTDTGAAVEKDLNGVGFVETGADGSFTYRFVGPAVVGIRPTDPFPKGPGYWELNGYHEFYIAPGGAYREMRVDLGSEHNVCTDID